MASATAKGAASAAKKFAKGSVGAIKKPQRHFSGSFSDVFKHLILTQTLPSMTYYSGTPITFYDFSPSLPRTKLQATSTHYQDGLQLLYEHARGEFDQQMWSPYQHYIGLIKKFSKQPGINVPPTTEDAPKVYPSAAGFASMFLREQDRCVLVQNDKFIGRMLEEEFSANGKMQVQVLEEMPSPNLAGYMLPPLTRNGLVYYDLDASFQHGQAAGQERTNYQQHLMTHVATVVEACKRWPRATYVIPYSLSPDEKVPNADFLRAIIKSGQQYVLNATMYMEHEDRGVGVVIINPPEGLDNILERILPDLKTIMFPKAKIGMHENISEVKVDWLTKRFVKTKHMTTSESRMTWLYSIRLAGLPLKPPEPPMTDAQWEYHLREGDPEKMAKDLVDWGEGTTTPPGIKLDTDEERRKLSNILKREDTHV